MKDAMGGCNKHEGDEGGCDGDEKECLGMALDVCMSTCTTWMDVERMLT